MWSSRRVPPARRNSSAGTADAPEPPRSSSIALMSGDQLAAHPGGFVAHMAASARQGAGKRRADPPAAAPEPLPVSARARVIARATLAILLILLGLWIAHEFL